MRAAAEQMALALGAVSESTTDWDLVLAWFRRAIDVIGHKEVAYRLDIAPSNLSDAINERERKDVKGRWIATVLRMAPPAIVQEYVELVCASHGFDAPKRRPILTPDAEVRHMRERLSALAPGVLQLIDKELGR